MRSIRNIFLVIYLFCINGYFSAKMESASATNWQVSVQYDRCLILNFHTRTTWMLNEPFLWDMESFILKQLYYNVWMTRFSCLSNVKLTINYTGPEIKGGVDVIVSVEKGIRGPEKDLVAGQDLEGFVQYEIGGLNFNLLGKSVFVDCVTQAHRVYDAPERLSKSVEIIGEGIVDNNFVSGGRVDCFMVYDQYYCKKEYETYSDYLVLSCRFRQLTERHFFPKRRIVGVDKTQYDEQIIDMPDEFGVGFGVRHLFLDRVSGKYYMHQLIAGITCVNFPAIYVIMLGIPASCIIFGEDQVEWRYSIYHGINVWFGMNITAQILCYDNHRFIANVPNINKSSMRLPLYIRIAGVLGVEWLCF